MSEDLWNGKGKERKVVPPGIAPRAHGLSCQCSATEPQHPLATTPLSSPFIALLLSDYWWDSVLIDWELKGCGEMFVANLCFFYALEDAGLLDPTKPRHIAYLHNSVGQLIYKELATFAKGWNMHSLWLEHPIIDTSTTLEEKHTC